MMNRREYGFVAVRTSLWALLCAACCIGCTNLAKPNRVPEAPGEATVAPAAREAVELTLRRDIHGPGRRRTLLQLDRRGDECAG